MLYFPPESISASISMHRTATIFIMGWPMTGSGQRVLICRNRCRRVSLPTDRKQKFNVKGRRFIMSKQQIGVMGLGVMGKNLALNIENKGYSVALIDKFPQKTKDIMSEA